LTQFLNCCLLDCLTKSAHVRLCVDNRNMDQRPGGAMGA